MTKEEQLKKEDTKEKTKTTKLKAKGNKKFAVTGFGYFEPGKTYPQTGDYTDEQINYLINTKLFKK